MEKETKTCPYCGEEILAVAKKCKHCGEWLEEKPKKMVPCPVCGEEIEEGSTVCPNCKEVLVRQQVTSNTVANTSTSTKVSSVLENATKIFDVNENKRIFKDFLAGHSIGKLFGIAVLINVVFIILRLIGVPAVSTISPICSDIIGIIATIIIIQRITENKSKADAATWIKFFAEIPWIIGIFVALDGMEDPGMDIFECYKLDDPNEEIVKLRYAIQCGFYWFIISLLCNALSMFLVWQTAKDKFKVPTLLAAISYLVGIIYIMTSKSLSAGSLFLFLCVTSLLVSIPYLWIIIKAWNEKGVIDATNNTKEKKGKSFFEKYSFLIIFGGIIAVSLIIGIIAYKCIDENPKENLGHNESSEYVDEDDIYVEEHDPYYYADSI